VLPSAGTSGMHNSPDDGHGTMVESLDNYNKIDPKGEKNFTIMYKEGSSKLFVHCNKMFSLFSLYK